MGAKSKFRDNPNETITIVSDCDDFTTIILKANPSKSVVSNAAVISNAFI